MYKAKGILRGWSGDMAPQLMALLSFQRTLVQFPGSYQPSVTPVPGNLTSSGFKGSCTHGTNAHIDTQIYLI